MTHYHVECDWLSDEARGFSAKDIFSALDFIAYELDQSADYEYESISALGQIEDYKGAFEAWQTTEALNGVVGNIRNICDQASGAKPRAPLYEGDGGYERLLITAENFLPDGVWGNGRHPFDPLPIKYTPGFYRCPYEDDSCEAWQEHLKEQEEW